MRLVLLVSCLAACSGADSGIPDAGPDDPRDASIDATPPSDDAIVLDEVYKKQPGPDVHEFIELFGTPDTSYADLTIVVLDGAGEIDLTFAVGRTDADGRFVTPFTDETLSNGTLTMLLVRDFHGVLGEDLDPDDDGDLDGEAWDVTLDGVALVDDPAAFAYAGAVIDAVPDEADGAARVPDGASTWVRHDPGGHGLEGVPGAGGQLCTGCGADAAVTGTALVTPGAPNALVTPGPVLDEVYKKQPGTDVHEFIEIYGAPATDLSAYTIVVLESDAGAPAGTIDLAYPVGTTSAAGCYATPYTNETLENGSLTVLLVTGYTGVAGTDLDTDDDGTLDVAPWTSVADSVALIDAADGIAYSASVITNTFDGGTDEPDGVARVPDGAHAALTDWKRHDPGGAGLAGVPGAGGALCATCGTTAAVSGTARVTPAATNTLVP